MALLLKSENLFAKGYIIELEDRRLLLKRDRPSYTPLANKDRTHIIKQGEKPWTIAYKFYGDDKWWHIIISVNNIFNPFELPVGLEIVIPDLDVIKVGQ